jgi:hypothetical protein
MKKSSTLIAATILVIFIIPAFAGKPIPGPQQVEVVNAPLDVNVVNQSSEFEYLVFRIEDGSVTVALENFQNAVNTYANEGWELTDFSYQQLETTTSHIYVGVMKRPIP